MTEAADRQWTRLLGRLIPRVARHRDYWFRALESECGALAVALVNAHGVAPQLAVTPPSGFDGDGLTAGRVLLALAGLGGAVAELVSVSAEEAYIAETVSGAIRGELRRAFAGNAVVPWRSNGGQTTRKEVKDPDPKT